MKWKLFFFMDCVHCKHCLVLNQMWSLSPRNSLVIEESNHVYLVWLHVGRTWSAGGFLLIAGLYIMGTFMCSFWLRNVWRTRRCFCFLKSPFFPGFVSVTPPFQAWKSFCLPSAETNIADTRKQWGATANCWRCGVIADHSSTCMGIIPCFSMSFSEMRLEGWLSMPVRNNTKRFGWEKKVPTKFFCYVVNIKVW